MQNKKIRLVFKNGAQVEVLYSAKIFAELTENLGKDHKFEGKNFVVNTADLAGVFYEVEEAATPAAPVAEEKKSNKK